MRKTEHELDCMTLADRTFTNDSEHLVLIHAEKHNMALVVVTPTVTSDIEPKAEVKSSPESPDDPESTAPICVS